MGRREGLIMAVRRVFLCVPAAVLAGLLLLSDPPQGRAYVGGPPLSLGMLCYWSTHVTVVRVEALDRDKGVVIFRKVRDVKGKWPADEIRHAFPTGFANRAHVLNWAEVGK